MPRIQIYERQVAPRVGVPQSRMGGGAGVDFSPIAQGLGQLANAAARSEDRAAREAAQQADEIRRLQAQQEADEARIWVSNTISAGRAQFTERLTAAQEGPLEQAPGLTAALLKDYDTWLTEQDQTAPQRAKAALKVAADELRTQIHGKAFAYETGARYAKLSSDFEAGLDADRRTVFSDPSQFEVTAARRMGAARGLGLPAADREKLMLRARDALATDAARGLVERDPESVLAAFGFTQYQRGARRGGGRMVADGKPATVEDDPILAHLPPERQQAVLHRAQTLVAQKKAAADARAAAAQAQAGQQARDIIWMLDNGFTPAAPDLMAAQRAAAGTPLAERLSRAMQEATAVQQFRLAAPAEQRAALNQARAAVDTPEGARLFEKLDKVAADAERRLKDDAFSYGVQVFGVQPTRFDPANPVQSLAARRSQAAVMQGQFGQPVSPLTPQEAEQLAESLRGLPPDQKAARLAEIGSALGDRQMIAALAKQMGGRDKAAAAAMMFTNTKTTRGRLVSQIILRGDQAVRDGTVKSDTAKESGWRAQIAREIGDAYPNEELRTQMVDAAFMVMQGLRAEGSTDVRRAVQLAAGRIVEQDDGTRLPLPYGWEESDFRKRLREFKPDQVGDVMIGAVKVPAADFVRQLPQASLVHAGQGKYSVRAGNGFVMDASGKRLVLDFNR